MARINCPDLKIMNFETDTLIPAREQVFSSQGMHPAAKINNKIEDIYRESRDLFVELVQPAGISTALGIEDFAEIYIGEGKNDHDNLLVNIYPHAEHLALFALTLGKNISRKIELLFQNNEFPLGYMLDTIASLAADKAAELWQEKNLEQLKKENLAGTDSIVLSYSPGYCGWHISGQKKLFSHLKPEKIGITLNDSYLMTPLKSVSGVFIAGRTDIHLFTPAFSYCKSCKTHSCLQRMKVLRQI